MRTLGLALVCTGVLVGCGDEASPPPAAPGSSAAAAGSPAPYRLLDHLEAEQIEHRWEAEALREAGPAALIEGSTPILDASFDRALPEGSYAWDQARPFGGGEAGSTPAPAAPRRRSDEARGGSVLRFDAPRGCLAILFPARPDTPYAFGAAVRHGFREALPDDAAVAEVLVYEFHSPPDPARHDGDPWTALEASLPTSAARHRLRRPEEAERWSERQFCFRSTVYTRSMAVVLVAGDPGWTEEASAAARAEAAQGWVEFDDVRLHELPLRRYLAVQDRSVQDELAFLDGTESFTELSLFRRRVKISGDLRRAGLAPVGTRYSMPLELPAGAWRLDLSYGLLEEGREGWGETGLRLGLRLLRDDGAHPASREVELAPGRDPAQRGWHELRFVGEGGGPARLELSVEGPEDSGEVVAFGEPILAAREIEDPPWNVLLISLDTLRADHLGCYGHRREDGHRTSPRLDAFAERCLRFDEFRTVAPYTLPSHATMMTGLYPRSHGVIHARRRLVGKLHRLLAEEFRAARYETAAFTGGGFVGYEYGFHQGFDRYSIVDPLLSEEDPLREDFPWPQQRALNDAAYARSDLDAVEGWIEDRADAPWFLFLHSFLVHNYHPPEELQARFLPDDPEDWTARRTQLHELDLELARLDLPPPPALLEVLRDLYDATIADADAKIGRLLDFLEARGLLERTVVVLTSDHGEEFGEHRGLLHGRTVYEEVLRVPLLLWVPGQEPGVVRAAADLADLAPTLLAAVGREPPADLDGRSLLAAERSGRTASWAEVDATNLSRRSAWISEGRKHIDNPEPSGEEPGYEKRRPPPAEAYDLVEDPCERNPLPDQPWADEAALTRTRLDERRHRWIPDETRLRARLSAGSAALLRALGYVVEESSEEASDED